MDTDRAEKRTPARWHLATHPMMHHFSPVQSEADSSRPYRHATVAGAAKPPPRNAAFRLQKRPPTNRISPRKSRILHPLPFLISLAVTIHTDQEFRAKNPRNTLLTRAHEYLFHNRALRQLERE